MILNVMVFFLTFRRFDGGVLTQSVKYMQKYMGTEYELKVSRCKKEDAGTYTVVAENSFGKREEKASLKVERKSNICLKNLIICKPCYEGCEMVSV